MVGFWVLGFGFWVLGFGFWVLGFGFWVLGFGFWVLGFGFWVAWFLFSSDEGALPGVARQLLTFFVSPKKVSKEKRPRFVAPYGGTRCCVASIGRAANSLRSDMRPSFSDCCNTSPATHKRKRRNCSLRIALLAQHGGFANSVGYSN